MKETIKMPIPHILSYNANWAKEKTRTGVNYIHSLLNSKSVRPITKDIQAFCLFIGYPRSGHSLIGSLLDAHPNSIVANELDALKFVNAGFSRDQIYYLLLRNSENHLKSGRIQTGYKYDVPNQWQGRFQRLLVIGDKKGGMTTQALAKDPTLFYKMKDMLKVPLKFIHVIRNPFDNITTMADRTRSPILKEIMHYLELCLMNAFILEMAGSENVLIIRHEALIDDPAKTLEQMLSFLDLEAPAGYIDDCAGIMYSSPNKSREKHPWSSLEKDLVLQQIKRFSFLADYTFDS